MIDKIELIEECLELFKNSKRRNYFTNFTKEQVLEILKQGKMVILCIAKNVDWIVASNLDEAIDQLASKYKLGRDGVIQNFEFSKFKMIQ